ncbi:helix-turn-helix transcriptional regulator [Nocardiopsis flavescens]|nr:helix-turn-helix transcriptional regulator [Nocardiopsis flavescens]
METRTMSVLGLNGVEEDVYRHFLRNPGSPEATARPAVPRGGAEVDAAVARLRGLGLLHGDGDGVWAADPAAAVARLSEDRLERVHSTIREIADIGPIMRSLQQDGPYPPRGRAPAAGAGGALVRLETLPLVRTHIDQLAFTARTEILASEPYEVLSPENIRHARPLDLRCLRRGVVLRNLVRADAAGDAATLEHLRVLRAAGAQVRVADRLSDLMLVYDRRTALVPLDPRDSGRGAFRVEEASLVESLVRYFDRLWDDARDLGELLGEGSETAAPTEAQLRVLELMCTVSKDETGARRAGMSLRTYRRHISDLLTLLQANNRARAALEARERGWV